MRKPVAFFEMDSVLAALDAAETEDERHAVFEAMGRQMLEEIEAVERDPEGHRPPEIRIERRKKT